MRTTKKTWIRKLAAAEKHAASRLASAIWELAEPPFQEHRSARLLADYLAEHGFRITWPFSMIPTAFRAIRGKGRPVVGFLGEYDALPDCGEKPGTFGHACGHNLLGVGSAVAAVVAARLLEKQNQPGRVVYWGCPAEEALAGKVYMARDGAFRGMDACLAWHPGSVNGIHAAGGATLDSLVFEFRGRTAHGAFADAGRSALDAAVLMDVAVNYLREHMPEHCRIHGVIRDGGRYPNVVPETAKIWYFARARDRQEAEDLVRRIRRCASGAAVATETRVRMTRLTALYNRLRNAPFARLLRDNFVLMGAPRATEADRRRLRQLGKEPDFAERIDTTLSGEPGRASSDEDTVSWLAPLACLRVACVARGTRGHHREYTAQSNLPFAHRGLLRAAEVLAATAWDLFTDRKARARIRAEFRAGTRGFRFDPLIPKSQRPPLRGV